MKIRKAHIEELIEPSIKGLPLESFRELLKKDINYDLFLAPIQTKSKKDTYHLYVDVYEPAGRRKNRAVLLAFREGARQFRLQAAMNTIEREFPKARGVRVLTRKKAEKVMGV